MGNTYTGENSSSAETSNIINAFLGSKAAETRNRQVDAEIAKMKIDAEQVKAEAQTRALTANVQLLQTMTLSGMKPVLNLEKFKASGGSDLLGSIDSIQIGDPQKVAIEKLKAENRVKAIEAKAEADQRTAKTKHGYKSEEIAQSGSTKAEIQKQTDDAAMARETLRSAVKSAALGLTENELAQAGRAVPYAGGTAAPSISTQPGSPGQPNIDVPGVFGSHIFGKVITPDEVMATGLDSQGAKLFTQAAQAIKNKPEARKAIIAKLITMVPKVKSLLNQ
jgi:hypothetical protein